MERPHLSARRARLAGLAVLLVLTATACGGRNTVIGKAPAATVDGTEITRAQVDQLSAAQLAYSKAAVKAGADPQGQAAGVIAASKSTGLQDTTGVAGASRALTSLIQRQIYEEAVVDAGEKLPTAAQVKKAVDGIKKQLDDAKITVGRSVEPLLDNEARIGLMSDLLRGTGKVSKADREAQLKAAYEQQVGSYTQACVNLIVSDSEANANAARAKIEGGAAFADVAKTDSLDPASAAAGGDAGCVAVADLAGIFGQDIYAANVGDLLGPATSQGSWLTVQVTSFDVPTFEDIRAQLDESTPKGDDAAALKALNRTVKRVKVSVDPRFGTWSTVTRSVTPPTDPTATTIATTTIPG